MSAPEEFNRLLSVTVEDARALGLRDPLDYAAYGGTQLLTAIISTPLLPVQLLTTGAGGLLHGLTLGLSGKVLGLMLAILFVPLRWMSVAWYRARWLRPLLLLPGWFWAVVAAVYVQLAPVASLNPQVASFGEAKFSKRWLAELVDGWPLTVILEEVLTTQLAALAAQEASEPRPPQVTG